MGIEFTDVIETEILEFAWVIAALGRFVRSYLIAARPLALVHGRLGLRLFSRWPDANIKAEFGLI